MKTVLITGGSRGIGAAAVRCFAARGWNVALNYFSSKERAERLAAELNSDARAVLCVQADVSDGVQVAAMFETVRERFGSLDCLVNNAGISRYGLFMDTDEQEWDEVFDINMKGMYHCCRQALPGMLSRRSGSIVNISSIWGSRGASCEVAYSASKAAAIGFTKALAKEVGPCGVRVNCVAPGVIETDMLDGFDEAELMELEQKTPLGRLGTAADVAGAIYYFASDDASYVTGQVLCPDGGFIG